MLGKRSDQKGLWEADRLYLDYVGQDTFYGLLAALRGQLFSDDDFADRRQLVLPVATTIFAGRDGVIIRYGGTVDYRPTSQAFEAKTYGRQDTGNGSGQGWDERLLRQKRMEGKTQETAAAKAGMSVRSARKWQSGPLPSATKPEHRWRTRPDPFDGVWEDEIEPLLRNDPTGKLKATTIIDCPSTSSGGRAASWAVQRIPAADAATTITGLAGAARSGPGGVLPPGASAGTGGPVRLHPLRGTQGDHRRTVLPPPAVPADTQSFGVKGGEKMYRVGVDVQRKGPD